MLKNLVKIPIVLWVIDLDLQGQIKLQSQNLPLFELVSLTARHVNNAFYHS